MNSHKTKMPPIREAFFIAPLLTVLGLCGKINLSIIKKGT